MPLDLPFSRSPTFKVFNKKRGVEKNASRKVNGSTGYFSFVFDPFPYYMVRHV